MGSTTLLEFLLRKLEKFVVLTDEDRRSLLTYTARIHRFGPREDIAKQGQKPLYTNVVLEGWACRYKLLEDGRRQVIAFLLPGDICDPMIHLIDQMRHSLGSLTPITVARFSHEDIDALTTEWPNLAKAFWCDALIANEIQREWMVNLGRRNAMQRMAHLFCELHLRSRSVGLSDGAECDLPVTQVDLADALGLSIVHVNRTLQDLRATGFADVKGRKLIIRDEQRLRTLTFFDPSYLHLETS